MKRILITGGSGFIGRNLCEQLGSDYCVYSPTRKELDLLSQQAVATYIKSNQIDIVVHSAVHVPLFHGAENEYYNDMRMFFNLEALSGQVEKILYFGSGAEYDKRFSLRRVEEEQIGFHIPETEYGLAKYTMNTLARGSQNIYNLRLFGVFGKYELWEIKFLSNLCCKVVFGLPLTVRRDCFFDFLWVDDLSGIVAWFLENTPLHHDYNVCMGNEYSLLQLAEMVRKISGKDLTIELLNKEPNLDYTASNNRLLSEVPALQITSMEKALHKLYQYYESHQSLVDEEALRRSR